MANTGETIPKPFDFAQGSAALDAESKMPTILDSRFRGNDKQQNQS
jgi:hypothetical protein